MILYTIPRGLSFICQLSQHDLYIYSPVSMLGVRSIIQIRTEYKATNTKNCPVGQPSTLTTLSYNQECFVKPLEDTLAHGKRVPLRDFKVGI